jgi:hypothetical protein
MPWLTKVVSVSLVSFDFTTHMYFFTLTTFSVSSTALQHLDSELTKFSGDGALTFIIMAVEAGVGVICGCLPGCKPLMSLMLPRVFGNTSNSNSQAYHRHTPGKALGSWSQNSFPSVRRPSHRSAGSTSKLQRQDSNLTQDRFMSEKYEKPLPSIPEPVVQIPRRSRGMSFGRIRRGSRGFHDIESGSEEIFIMQRIPADRRNMEHFA